MHVIVKIELDQAEKKSTFLFYSGYISAPTSCSPLSQTFPDAGAVTCLFTKARRKEDRK